MASDSIFDAIILGGGVGKRFSDEDADSLPKQFQSLHGEAVFLHSVKRFLGLCRFRRLVLTFPESHLDHARKLLEQTLGSEMIRDTFLLVAGGARRQDSARKALVAIEKSGPPPDRVVIHDACRPHLSSHFLARISSKLDDNRFPVWIPTLPTTETLKRISGEEVTETLDRTTVHRVQTPQILDFKIALTTARRAEEIPERDFTDDASLCEYYGIPVGVFAGDPRNLKLTYSHELETLERTGI